MSKLTDQTSGNDDQSLAGSVFGNPDLRSALNGLSENLIITSDALRDALIQLRDQVDMAHARSLQPSSMQDAMSQMVHTREQENFRQTTKFMFDEHFKKLSEGLSEFLGKTVATHQKTLSDVHEQASKTFWGKFKENFEHAEHSVAHSMHLSGAGEHAFEFLTSKIHQSVHQIKDLTSQIPLAGAAVTAFSGAVAAIASFGVGQAGNLLHGESDFEKTIMRSSPLAAESIFHTMQEFGAGGVTPLDQLAFNLKTHLTGSVDSKQLINTAFGLRLPEDTSMQNVQNISWGLGFLQEKGVSASSTVLKMTYDLRESAQEATSGLVHLAGTAAKNSWDIGNYINRIVDLSSHFLHLGYSIADVDKVFQEFAQHTLPNGAKLTYEAASTATEMYLGLRRNVSLAESVVIAEKYGEGLHNEANFGFTKVDESLAELTKKGFAGQFLASQLFKKGDVSGATDAYVKYVNDMIDEQMSRMDQSGFSDKEQKNNRFMMVAQKLGLYDQISALGPQGDAARDLVRKVSEREFISDKNIHTALSDIFKDSLDGTLGLVKTTFPQLIGKVGSELTEMQRLTSDYESMWLKLRDFLGGVFVPILESVTSTVAAVGVWLEAGGVLSPTSGKKALEKYEETQKEFRAFNENSTLSFLFKTNPTAANIAFSLGVAPDSVSRTMSPGDRFRGAIETALATSLPTAIPFLGYKFVSEMLSKNKNLSTLPQIDRSTGQHFQLNTDAAQAFKLADLEARQKYGKGIPLSSAYRSPEHNAAIGGAPNSNHIHGKAIDIDYASVTWAKELLEKHGFKQLGGKFFRNGRWQSEDNHFDYKPRLLAKHNVNVYKNGQLIGQGVAMKKAS